MKKERLNKVKLNQNRTSQAFFDLNFVCPTSLSMKKSTFSKILNKTRETKGEEVEIGQSNTIYKNHSLSPFRNASIFFMKIIMAL